MQVSLLFSLLCRSRSLMCKKKERWNTGSESENQNMKIKEPVKNLTNKLMKSEI